MDLAAAEMERDAEYFARNTQGVRKHVLWAYSDGTYALIDPSTGYPAPSAQGEDAFERYERAMLCGGDPGAPFAPNH